MGVPALLGQSASCWRDHLHLLLNMAATAGLGKRFICENQPIFPSFPIFFAVDDILEPSGEPVVYCSQWEYGYRPAARCPSPVRP